MLRFLQCAEEDLAPFVARLREPALKHAIGFGVAFLHEGMLPTEREAVEALFESGAIQVRDERGDIRETGFPGDRAERHRDE